MWPAMNSDRKDAGRRLKPTAILGQASLMECQLLAAALKRQCRLEVVASGITSSEVERAVHTRDPDPVLITAHLQDVPHSGLNVARTSRGSNTQAIVSMPRGSDDRSELVQSV